MLGRGLFARLVARNMGRCLILPVVGEGASGHELLAVDGGGSRRVSTPEMMGGDGRNHLQHRLFNFRLPHHRRRSADRGAVPGGR